MKKVLVILSLLFIIIGDIRAMSVEIPLYVSFDKEDEHIRHIPSRLSDNCIMKLDDNVVTINFYKKDDLFNLCVSLFDVDNNLIYSYQDVINTVKVSFVVPQSVLEKSISLSINVNGTTYEGNINS